MKQTIMFLMVMLVNIICYGQVEEDDVIVPSQQTNKVDATDTTRLHGSICEIMPEFIDGWGKYYEFLKANLNRKNITDSTGKVYVRIIVNKQGDVASPYILRGHSKSTNEECLRVVKLLKFTPGLQHKKPVYVPLDLIIPLDPNFSPKIKSKRHKR